MRLTLLVSPVAASEKSLTRGLYIHIPFCKSKCNYCDFYSGNFSDELKQEYVQKLCEEIEKWGRLNTCPIDTIYFGGGTPSLLSTSQLSLIFTSIHKAFAVTDNAEITVEVNPGDDNSFIETASKLSVNRISVGIQSSVEKELEILGRRHSYEDAFNTIDFARKVGIENISADLMIGLQNSSIQSLDKSLLDILTLDLPHISSYILKIEENTNFYKSGIVLPDDDAVAEQYLHMCEAIESKGYEHYEISNFAKKGFQSRHNNKYWLCEEYIGIGPSAHSFFDGKRMFYPRNIQDFLKTPTLVFDGDGGDKYEYLMLSLRLSRGLIFKEFEERFGKIPDKLTAKAKLFKDYCNVSKKGISLTNQGMLLSNTIINQLTEVL